MKTKTLAATTILALMLAGIATVAYAHPTLSPHTPQTNQAAAATDDSRSHQKDPGSGQILKDSEREDHQDDGDHDHNHDERLDLKVGQTITLSNLTGKYMQIGNRTIRGDASGSFTFTVTGVFRHGFTLSITSGTIKLGDQTYTVNGGSVQTGPHGRDLVGQGTAGTGVQFLIHGKIPGQSEDSRAMVMLDLEHGSTEYAVFLRAPTS